MQFAERCTTKNKHKNKPVRAIILFLKNKLILLLSFDTNKKKVSAYDHSVSRKELRFLGSYELFQKENNLRFYVFRKCLCTNPNSRSDTEWNGFYHCSLILCVRSYKTTLILKQTFK
jgi:hypothetical protein